MYSLYHVSGVLNAYDALLSIYAEYLGTVSIFLVEGKSMSTLLF